MSSQNTYSITSKIGQIESETSAILIKVENRLVTFPSVKHQFFYRELIFSNVYLYLRVSIIFFSLNFSILYIFLDVCFLLGSFSVRHAAMDSDYARQVQSKVFFYSLSPSRCLVCLEKAFLLIIRSFYPFIVIEIISFLSSKIIYIISYVSFHTQ